MPKVTSIGKIAKSIGVKITDVCETMGEAPNYYHNMLRSRGWSYVEARVTRDCIDYAADKNDAAIKELQRKNRALRKRSFDEFSHID